MARVLTLTPSPALDVTIRAASTRAGATHRVSPASYRLGGKGVNVANILADQGYKATAMGLVAPADVAAFGGTGYPSERHVSELNPRLERRFTATALRLRSTWSIYSAEDGDTAMFNEPAPAFPPADLEQLARDLLRAVREDPTTVVTISGSLPDAVTPDALTRLLASLYDASVPVIVDTHGEALVAACAARPAWVKPNRDELAQALGYDDPRRGARELKAAGARSVAVSLGKEGLLLVTDEGALRARLAEPVEGNPTGAGDAVVAALASALIDGASLPDTARRSVAWSAAAVLSPVAGEIAPQWRDLQSRVLLTHLTTD